MAVILLNNQEGNALDNEPYVTLKRKFDIVKENINNKRIEIELSQSRRNSFADGFFYEGREYIRNYELKFMFVKITNGDIEGENYLIRMEYLFELSNNGLYEYEKKRNAAIRKRGPFFYIRDVKCLEVTTSLDDEYNKISFDAVVPNDLEIIEQTCYALLNQIISICSTEF